jgi:2-polyprenyl-3-methyl-5-hydroxy-6-metoxy-1,4-benzoquinol methylase
VIYSNNGLERSATTAFAYWEARARRFAVKGEGLAAVCSYGMPRFYNRAIDLCQRLALRPWLALPAGTRVLDVGCGVGRWSREMAARGADVTGVDLSNTMVTEAVRRAAAAGLSARCRFLAQDLAELQVPGRFGLVLGVTVMQHILDEDRVLAAMQRLARHLAPKGRIVLLEAAPTRPVRRCDSSIFSARSLAFYLALFQRCDLAVEAITGVDPMPLKTRFLPYYGRLPRPVALCGLAAVTAASLPLDALLGRQLMHASWHKVFVLRHAHRRPA